MSYKGQVPDKSGQPIISVRLVNDADADSGVGTQLDPVRVDPVGTTVQPVSFSSPQHVIVDSGGGGGGGGAVTVADGADVAQGATTDAAVTTDVNGTLSAKLRGLVKIHASVWDSVNNRFKVDGSGVTQPISATALPLPTNASQDGTDATGVASPTGAVGIRGWLSSIYNILKNSTIGVTGTFFQATQPVSIAATISSNLAQVAAATVATAASGVQKVGVVGGAGTSLETTAGVIDNNVKNIGNAAVATAASGVQKVGVVDASGNALNSDGAGNLRVNPYGNSGSFKVYKIASTAGNVVAQIAVPAGKKWIVQSANVTLTTNATAGTRQLQMYSSNATPDYIASVWSGFTQAASLAGFYTFAPSVPTNTGSIANNQNVTVGFPQLFLEAGFILYFSVTNGLAGDAFVVRGINVIEVND